MMQWMKRSHKRNGKVCQVVQEKEEMMKRRIIIVVMALALIVGVAPVAASAADHWIITSPN